MSGLASFECLESIATETGLGAIGPVPAERGLSVGRPHGNRLLGEGVMIKVDSGDLAAGSTRPMYRSQHCPTKSACAA